MYTYAVFIILNVCGSIETAKDSFQLRFPITDHTSFASCKETITKPLEELTLCYWTRPFNITNWAYVFSYSLGKDGLYELIAGRNDTVWFYHVDGLPGMHGKTSPAVNHQWMHYCFTWSFAQGELMVYENGQHVDQKTDYKVGHRIRINGSIRLGKGHGGDLETWKGDISEVHLWDYTLCESEIQQLANCDSPLKGNVFNWWTAVLNLQLEGEAVIKPVVLCPIDTCEAQ